MVAIRLTGSDETLRALAQKLRKVSPRIALVAAQKVAPVIQELSDRPWQRRASVEGKPWAPRKGDYPHPILEKTGKTRRTVRSAARGTNVVTSTRTPYARYHQHGTARMKARPIFPTGQLPSVWIARINRTLNEHIKKVLSG